MSMLDQLNLVFLSIFSNIYVYIHSHFVSYLLFLALILALSKVLYDSKKYFKKKSDGQTLTIKLLWALALSALLIFDFWYIFIHFHTFRLLP